MLVGVVLLGLVLRAAWLPFEPLASDDAYSWRMVEPPLSAVLARVAADTHPPLYYLALHGWFRVFGDSIASLRGFSLLFGVLSVLAAAWLAREAALHFGLDARAASLSAALLVAIHAGPVEISRLGRMYTLGACLAAASAALLVRALARPTPARWAAYVLATAAFAATHYYSAFTLVCHPLLVLHAFLRRRGSEAARHVAVGFCVAVAWIGLLYSPWLPTLAAQTARVAQEYWVRPLEAEALGPVLATWATGLDVRGAAAPGLIAAWAALAVWAALRAGVGASLLLAFGVLPWLLAAAISWLGERPLIVPRYLGFAQLFLLVFWALAFAGLGSARARGLLAALVLAPVATGAVQTVARYPASPTAELLAARWAAEVAQRGDLVMTDSARAVNRLRYLLHDLGGRAVPVLGVAEPNLADRIHAPAMAPGDVVTTREACAIAGRRVLWIGIAAPKEELPGFAVAEKRPFEGALRSRRVARVYVRSGQAPPGSGS